MNDNDLELKRLGKLLADREAPVVDVTDRVMQTLQQLPVERAQSLGRTMAACAIACAATAASAGLAAIVLPTQTEEADNAVELVFDAHEITVDSYFQ